MDVRKKKRSSYMHEGGNELVKNISTITDMMYKDNSNNQLQVV